MTWQNIQNLLPKAAGKYNFAKALKAIEICQEYRNFANKYLPKEALKNTYPKSYKNQTLTVGVSSSSWAEKVQLNKHRIHQSLTKKFGPRAVKNVKIVMCEEIPAVNPPVSAATPPPISAEEIPATPPDTPRGI